MTASRATSSFACTAFGSPSIRVRDGIYDAADAPCAGCGAELGSRFAFKAQTRQAILREITSGMVSTARASSDIPIWYLDASAGHR